LLTGSKEVLFLYYIQRWRHHFKSGRAEEKFVSEQSEIFSSIACFYEKKTGFVGTVLSTRSVLWTWNIPKMRWRTPLGKLTTLI